LLNLLPDLLQHALFPRPLPLLLLLRLLLLHSRGQFTEAMPPMLMPCCRC
jgi:hypothetical protein